MQEKTLKGVLTQKFLSDVFLLQYVEGDLSAITRHINCSRARKIIIYGLYIAD